MYVGYVVNGKIAPSQFSSINDKLDFHWQSLRWGTELASIKCKDVQINTYTWMYICTVKSGTACRQFSEAGKTNQLDLLAYTNTAAYLIFFLILFLFFSALVLSKGCCSASFSSYMCTCLQRFHCTYCYVLNILCMYSNWSKTYFVAICGWINLRQVLAISSHERLSICCIYIHTYVQTYNI